MKNNTCFECLLACQSAFDNVKKIVTSILILAHYKQSIKTILEKDLSNYVSSEVLSQLDNNRLLYLVTFFFMNFNPLKCNYETYNIELLAIIRCF